MNMALGEFLTEMGRVEFRMLLYMDIVNEAPLEHLFAEYDGETFGTKRKLFIRWCEFGSVPLEQEAMVKGLYKDTADLQEKRNFIVHGETWEGGLKGQPPQPYRVGLVAENLEYLDEFERGEHGPNVFNLQQLRKASTLCKKISGALQTMHSEIVAGAALHEQEPSDGTF
jgi:hypothetical protein